MFVRPGTGAAVGVVPELMDMEAVLPVRQPGQLPGQLHRAAALLVEVDGATHPSISLQDTHGLHLSILLRSFIKLVSLVVFVGLKQHFAKSFGTGFNPFKPCLDAKKAKKKSTPHLLEWGLT